MAAHPAPIPARPATAVAGQPPAVAAAPRRLPALADPGTNPAEAYVASLAPTSRRTQGDALGVLACLLLEMDWPAIAALRPAERWQLALGLDWGQVRSGHVGKLRAQLAERYAPATANGHLAALRRVLRCARSLGRMAAVDHEAAVADLAPVRGNSAPAGRSLPAAELGALFDSCADDPRPQGARDAAMLAVLYGAGLRRAELVGLDLADYDPDSGALAVRGKGRRHRTTYVTNGAAEAVGVWLGLRGAEPGPLFVGITRHGRLDPQRARMTGQAVLAMLRRRAAQAGVAGFSPHDLRRSYAGDMLDAGADLATVQTLMGHASPTTTARYDRRPEAARRRAAERLHVPYRRRVAA
jgi:site-specific recombinase XerD